jgi:hypothetical protein
VKLADQSPYRLWSRHLDRGAMEVTNTRKSQRAKYACCAQIGREWYVQEEAGCSDEVDSGRQIVSLTSREVAKGSIVAYMDLASVCHSPRIRLHAITSSPLHTGLPFGIIGPGARSGILLGCRGQVRQGREGWQDLG